MKGNDSELNSVNPSKDWSIIIIYIISSTKSVLRKGIPKPPIPTALEKTAASEFLIIQVCMYLGHSHGS